MTVDINSGVSHLISCMPEFYDESKNDCLLSMQLFNCRSLAIKLTVPLNSHSLGVLLYQGFINRFVTLDALQCTGNVVSLALINKVPLASEISDVI